MGLTRGHSCSLLLYQHSATFPYDVDPAEEPTERTDIQRTQAALRSPASHRIKAVARVPSQSSTVQLILVFIYFLRERIKCRNQNKLMFSHHNVSFVKMQNSKRKNYHKCVIIPIVMFFCGVYLVKTYAYF